MDNPAVIRSSANISTGGTWDKVSSTSVVCSGTLRVKSTNTGSVTVRHSDFASEAHVLEAGSSWPLVNIDLSKIEVTADIANQGFEFVGDTFRGSGPIR